MVATVLLASLGIALGNWQSNRAQAKTDIAAAMATEATAPPLHLDRQGMPAPNEFRRVVVTGHFVTKWPVYLDNRPQAGASGFYVLMPFRIAATGGHVMVARGWAPRHVADRTRLPEIPFPDGEVTLSGIVRKKLPRVMELGEKPPLAPGIITQNASIDELERATGLTMLPFFMQQTSSLPDGLIRDWPEPSTGIDKHRGYAFQWYGLALMAVLFFIVTGIRREPR